MAAERYEQIQGLEGIRPGPRASADELSEALSDVLHALDAGQSAASMRESEAGMPGPSGPYAAPTAPLPGFDRPVVRIRTSPSSQADPIAAESDPRMPPTTTRGPFRNDAGDWIWVDTYAPSGNIQVYVNYPVGTPMLLALLPITPGSTALSAGAVWLATAALVPGRPLDEFVGLPVSGGSVGLDTVVGTTSTTITLGGDWRLRLDVDVAAPPGAGAAGGPGEDASAATVGLPASATFDLRMLRAAKIGFSDAHLGVYGSSVTLSRSTDPAFYDAVSASVVVPATASAAAFAFTDVRSQLWKIGDAADISGAGWALPVARAVSGVVTDPQGAGSLALRLDGPLKARWTGLGEPLPVHSLLLYVAPGQITAWPSVHEPGVVQRLLLWQESGASPPRRSSIDFAVGTGPPPIYRSRPGVEQIVFLWRSAVGHFDRPVTADGGRIRVAPGIASLALSLGAEGTSVTVVAFGPNAADPPRMALALENALLNTGPPGALRLTGHLVGESVDQGELALVFTARALLPILPDPYATNHANPRGDPATSFTVQTSVTWPVPTEPKLSFGMRGVPTGAGSDAPLVLLDVSSNADQFGLAIPTESASSLSLEGLSVRAPGDVAAVITLPPISWEPMLTKSPDPGSGDIPLPSPPHDGGPAVVRTQSTAVTPLAPIPLLASYLEAIGAGDHFEARLPLPFGLIADVDTHQAMDPNDRPTFLARGGSVLLNQPAFEGPLVGGLQVAIRGGPADPARDPTLPGLVHDVGAYTEGVLSTDIYTRFTGDFGSRDSGQGVPVRRYELSGYGASLFSDWRDHAAVGPAIIQARFDVLVGRASHVVVQMQSVLYPQHIRVVRTITIDRTDGGWVLREDSGWLAAGDGRLAYEGDPAGNPAVAPAFAPEVRHPGLFEAAERVRTIRLAAPQFSVPARAGETDSTPTTWQPVTFDCDVAFATGSDPRLVVTGGSDGKRTPSHGATGWILIDGPKYTTQKGGQTVTRVRPAGAPQVFDLLSTHGPGTLPINCSLLLGGTDKEPGLLLGAARVEVACNQDSVVPHLVAAVRGSAALPRDGAWSVVRTTEGDAAPKALDPSFPVPVVGPNASYPGSGRWHVADPADITALADTAKPSVRYGFLQSFGTQTILFDRPRVGNDPKPITLPRPPYLADMGALLGAVGPFPGLADAFDFVGIKDLAVTDGALSYHDEFPLVSAKQTVLMDLGGPQALQVLLDYHDEQTPAKPTQATITVDPAASPRWSLSLKRVCFLVDYHGEPLVSIFGTVKVDEHSAPTVEDLWVTYGGTLKFLEAIFTNVQQVARFLPGSTGAGLKVAFSGEHLSVLNAFALPNLPLGAGQITDVAVNMGFDVSLAPRDVRFVAGLGSPQQPFRWIVSPLAGTGVVQVAIGPNGLDVVVQGGLGLGLAIDLGIASGAASVAIAFELNTGPDPFELRAILSGRASVDVLEGLASATITLSAGLGVIPPPQFFEKPFVPPEIPPPTTIPEITIGLTASVSVGIHLSACWVADVDWDGYWQFRQDITTPEIALPLP
ncbi:hypothetical protein ACGFRG_02085 [Streptomyces sp. NPDC048696]|uniref:hypothetical protein n=1 Tax=Streptomyces sp. NPDC048696 TaxID=3365585 RepID=UPI003710E521